VLVFLLRKCQPGEPLFPPRKLFLFSAFFTLSPIEEFPFSPFFMASFWGFIPPSVVRILDLGDFPPAFKVESTPKMRFFRKWTGPPPTRPPLDSPAPLGPFFFSLFSFFLPLPDALRGRHPFISFSISPVFFSPAQDDAFLAEEIRSAWSCFFPLLVCRDFVSSAFPSPPPFLIAASVYPFARFVRSRLASVFFSHTSAFSFPFRVPLLPHRTLRWDRSPRLFPPQSHRLRFPSLFQSNLFFFSTG